MVYRASSPGDDQRQFVWIDWSGTQTGKVVFADTAGTGPSLTSDGRNVALALYKEGNMDIWSYEIERRAWNRITFDAGDDIAPVWSSDGRRIAFGSNRIGGIMNLYRKVLSGPPGSEELLVASPRILFATDWSSNGFLLYDSVDRKSGNSDIGRCRWTETTESRSRLFIRTLSNEEGNSLPTETGWPISPTGRANRKYMSSGSLVVPETAFSFLQMAGFRRVGIPKARNCFTLGWTDG